MKQSPQTRKHIVSKAEYVRIQGKRAQAILSGVAYLSLAVLSGFAGASLIAIVCYYLCFPTRHFLLDIFVFKNHYHPQDEIVCLAIFDGGAIVALFGLAYVHGTFGYNQIIEAARTDPGVPFTRMNTADLPASESLVRASEEPTHEHQTVLLRAAIETTERHEEQLVRAAGGTE